MKYWEIIVNKMTKTGFSVGWVSAVDDHGRTLWIVDAHREGMRFFVRADEKLTAFLELQRAIHEFAVSFQRIELESCVRLRRSVTVKLSASKQMAKW